MEIGLENLSISEKRMNPFVSNGNKLKWKFENVKDLDENGEYSDEFEIGPTKWKIKIRTKLVGTMNYLAVYLYCTGDNLNEKNWICRTEETITMVNQNENENDVSETDLICYSNARMSWGWHQLYKWDDLIKNHYMKNDSIIVEIDFSFKYYDFSKNIPNLTDIILKVEDIEFYTSKAILCTQSEYFYDLFVNQNYKKSEIEIKDVELNDFRFFLASFYRFFNGVEDMNFEKLIELAEKYKFSVFHKNVEQYLLKNTTISLEKKLEYADKYDYYDLMKQCVQLLDAQKIKNLRKTYGFRNFKESTKLMIMTRLLDFC